MNPTDPPIIRYEKLFENTQLPDRATPGSAGLDLYAHLDRDTILAKSKDEGSPTAMFVGEVWDDLFWEGGRKTLSARENIYIYGDETWAIRLRPGDKALIPLGFKMALPLNFEAQIRPRSGMSFKRGIAIPNAPGTIDSDFRNECCVLVHNVSDRDEIIHHGDRIAQMVIAKYAVLASTVVQSLEDTDRKGGFGSTGAFWYLEGKDGHGRGVI